MAENMRERLQEVFRDIFDDPSLVLRDEMSSLDIDGWDSLMHVNIIVAAERKFGIKFTTAEISRTKAPGQNVGSFLVLIEAKLAAK
jgi:acyl carrier protein